MKNNNQINIPQAREAMDRFKMQAASEVGVNLTNGWDTLQGLRVIWKTYEAEKNNTIADLRGLGLTMR